MRISLLLSVVDFFSLVLSSFLVIWRQIHSGSRENVASKRLSIAGNQASPPRLLVKVVMFDGCLFFFEWRRLVVFGESIVHSMHCIFIFKISPVQKERTRSQQHPSKSNLIKVGKEVTKERMLVKMLTKK